MFSLSLDMHASLRLEQLICWFSSEELLAAVEVNPDPFDALDPVNSLLTATAAHTTTM